MARWNGAISSLLPAYDEAANKFTRGRARLFVGSPQYPGAACLAAVASQRAGAGYTEVITDEIIVPLIQAYRASLVVRPYTPDVIASGSSAHPCAYVVGCGTDGADPATAVTLLYVLENANGPVVVDGGALAALALPELREIAARRAEEDDAFRLVLTPHGGEAARLAQPLGIASDDPNEMAAQLARAYQSVVVLKGPDTYISDGITSYCMTEGTAALAKAGTGDVLAGILGGLLAQQVNAFDACVLGTTLHARAGQLAAQQLGWMSVCAEDVLEQLPTAIRSLQ